MNKRSYEYTLPAHWANVFVNNDYTGLSEEEIKEIENWLASEDPGMFLCLKEDEEEWFSHTNDATKLGGNVLTFIFC